MAKYHIAQFVEQLVPQMAKGVNFNENFQLAQTHFERQLELAVRLGESRAECAALTNLANMYMRTMDEETGTEYLERALVIAQQNNYLEMQAQILSNLGVTLGGRFIGDRLPKPGEETAAETGFCGRQPLRQTQCYEQAVELLNKIWTELPSDEARLAETNRFSVDSAHRNLIFSLVWTHAHTRTRAHTCMRAHTCTQMHRLRPQEALVQAEHKRSRALHELLLRQRVGTQTLDPTFSKMAMGMLDEQEPESLHRHVVPLDFEALRSFAQRQRVALLVYSKVRERPDEGTTLGAWVLGSNGQLASEQLQILPCEGGPLSHLVELARRSIGAGERHMSRATAECSVDEGRLRQELQALTSGCDTLPAGSHVRLQSLKARPDLNGSRGMVAGGTTSVDRVRVVVGSQSFLLKPENLKLLSNESIFRRCHRLLIEPFSAALQDEPHLLVLPDLDLYALPFAALIDEHGTRLIEQHSISIAPSVGTVLELERRAQNIVKTGSTVNAVVVGDPSFHGRLPQLTGARKEARAVFDILDDITSKTGGNAAVLLGDKANKAAVIQELSMADYAHFATHGEPDGIYLSSAQGDDGKLTMAEVQALELSRSKMVVLSACDSFKGELNCDGVIGIARSFLAAGSSTLLASLWKVSDDATQVLMARFYERLFGIADGNVALALQGAMVSMLAEYDVGQWAAFTIYGLAK